MNRFCTECGNPIQLDWKTCPYCGVSIYYKTSAPLLESELDVTNLAKNPFNNESEGYSYNKVEAYPYYKLEEIKKGLTKKQKKAIGILIILVAVAIIIPVIGFSIYLSNFHVKTVDFYVNNGSARSSYTSTIPRTTYQYYSNLPHPTHSYYDWNLVVEAIEPYCTPEESEILKIAQDIRAKCYDQNDDEEVVNALLSFTQGIIYKSDSIDKAQYPIETLINQGDCEDMSVFFGSLVESIGYEAIIMGVEIYDDIEEEWIGHMCVGVHLDFTPTHHLSYPPSYYYDVSEDDNQYWMCETTDQGWMIGQLSASQELYFSVKAYEFVN